MTTRRIRCGRCRAVIITGRDDLGIEVALDPTPLDDPATELTAVLDGIRTWGLHTTTETITHRSAHRIVANPAGTRPRITVHGAHRCEERSVP
jgi:hypothetical protein